jgi:hypothetical protein
MKKKLLYFSIVITLIIGIGVLQIKYGNETLYAHINKNYDFYASYFVKFFPLVLFSIIGLKLISPNSNKRFLRIQASLPTSKINSLAMGLVEVQGQLIMKTPLISPVANQECIGYYYTIEDINRDKEGNKSYTNIHKETKCNPFDIQDKTGNIKIQPEEIEFIMLETTNIHSNNSKRYRETLLTHGQEMLLVGYADVNNNVPFIRKDMNRKVFGITSNTGITLWNKYNFLLQSFLITSFFIAVIIVLIMLN